MQDENQNIESEANEVVEETSQTTSPQLDRILSLENMINGYILDLAKLQKDLKEQSAMLKDTFENDAEYMEVQEKAKEVAKVKKQIKDRLSQDQSVALLIAKVDDLKLEVKDVKQALSDYLYQYYKESGLSQITASDGEIHELVTSVRLVKKKE